MKDASRGCVHPGHRTLWPRHGPKVGEFRAPSVAGLIHTPLHSRHLSTPVYPPRVNLTAAHARNPSGSPRPISPQSRRHGGCNDGSTHRSSPQSMHQCWRQMASCCSVGVAATKRTHKVSSWTSGASPLKSPDTLVLERYLGAKVVTGAGQQKRRPGKMQRRRGAQQVTGWPWCKECNRNKN